MQKVITVNLNGNAYSLEEPGYEALRVYLDRARARLQDNPDRAEILSDIEQAIAEKCVRYLNPGKTVVTSAEIGTILSQMGPVENADAPAGNGGEAQKAGAASQDAGAPKRLYQIREGAMISGVCTGLAAYFNVDVTIVRIAFVGLAIITAGAWVLVYLAMMFIVPYANTGEDRAAAFGIPFTVQELIAQAKRNHALFRIRHEARQQRREARARRRHERYMHRHGFAPGAPPDPQPMGYAERATWGVSMPFLAIASAALFVMWIFALISLFSTHTIFGIPLPEGVPFWVWVVALFGIYGTVSAPFRVARHGWRHYWGQDRLGPWAALHGALWMVFAILFFWFAYTQFPGAQALIDSMPSPQDLWDQITT